jgi:D-ribose pyranose/furanose isomerase RbsD
VTFAGSARMRIALLLSVAVTVAVAVISVPVPAQAAPGDPGDEGGTPSLRQALENAAKGYNDAKAKLANSVKRQAQIGREQKITEAKVLVLSKDVQILANTAYKGGRMNMLSAALDSGSMPAFLDRSEMLGRLSWKNNQRITALAAAREDLERQKVTLAREIKVQQVQEKAMAKRKADAEKALAAVGGGAAGGFSANSAAAQPAPRNSDGSWPDESCSVNDPTTDGCLTPRTNHALKEARLAGFTHYTACFRNASSGEHGKGRACDLAAAPDGFEDVAATGDDKAYGNRLAAWCINNADRLGVMYVIWYRQIWMPSTGWRSYDGGGSPSSAHTNHVHLSML